MSDIINGLSIAFSEPTLPSTVTNAASFSLAQSGPDGSLGTRDDVVYPLAPAVYATGNVLSLVLVDGPLQPGETRFSVSVAVTDRAGNPVTPAFTRNFTIERLGMFNFENRSNDTATVATSLSLSPTTAPDGSFTVASSYTAGINPHFVLSRLFNSDANLDLASANLSSGNVSILLGNGDGTFGTATNFTAGNGPVALASGDFNRDGLTARLYVNGQFMASGAVESNYIGTKTGTRIGSEVCCGGNTFPGYIDEVAVWSRPLTGAEVQARMAGPLSGTENGLAGYWPFNEGMGTTAADASGQGHPGTLQNGAAWTALALASAGEPGLMAQYLLWIELRDQLSPSILSDTLPAEGTTVIGLVSGFALTFSEDMLAETINSAASYELRSSGVDGQFGTADDQLWPITTSPAYGSGLTANYRVLGAPLLPGAYRFTVTTAVRDRAGNPIPAPWTRQFVIGQIPGFSTELEPNNSAETATPLPMNSTQPDLVSRVRRLSCRLTACTRSASHHGMVTTASTVFGFRLIGTDCRSNSSRTTASPPPRPYRTQRTAIAARLSSPLTHNRPPTSTTTILAQSRPVRLFSSAFGNPSQVRSFQQPASTMATPAR
ncbi:MAG: Ig-like domain-containing protein [Verrucomicrobiota bacterium]|nr:Ig-like domain-containing protein [Verrucomicrobiota bacterium]